MKAAAFHVEPEVRTIAAGEFKAKCLQLMDEVMEKKFTLIITKHGKPVSQLTAPVEEKKPFRSVVGRNPGMKLPANFEELKGTLAVDWEDPVEKWVRANSDGKRKKKKR